MGEFEIPQRSRTRHDDVLSTQAAADALGQTRQGVHSAAHNGTIEAFQDPVTRRIWISRDAVLKRTSQPGPMADLEARVSALEALVAAKTPSSTDDELSTLRAENATLRGVNVLLLAAAADHQEVDRHRRRAAKRLRKALKAERQATERSEAIASTYRDALAQTQLPTQPPDPGT